MGQAGGSGRRMCPVEQFLRGPSPSRRGRRAGRRHSTSARRWAVTHQDLDAFAAVLDAAPPGVASWCDPGLHNTFVQVAQKLAAPGSVRPDLLVRDPVSTLTQFLLRPDRTAWESTAHSFAVALARGQAVRTVDSDAVPDLLRAEIGGEACKPAAGDVPVLIGRLARGAVVAVERRSMQDVRVWLAVDDRDMTVGSADQIEAWRDWLAAGNILQFLPPGRFHAPSYSTAEPVAAAPVALPGPWQEIIDVCDGPVRGLAVELAEAGVSLPEPGHEIDDGAYQLDLAWPDHRLAVVLDDVDDDEDADERDAWLSAHGWTVLPPEVEAVRAALSAVGGG